MKEDAHFVECNKCKEQISRGGRNSKTFNTTNLVQHLWKHSEEFKKYEKEKDANALKESQTPKQLSLEETEDRIRPWKVNDSRAQRPPCGNGSFGQSTFFCCQGQWIRKFVKGNRAPLYHSKSKIRYRNNFTKNCEGCHG